MKGLALSKERKVSMSEQTEASASQLLSLPESPDLDWLRKQARRRLNELRKINHSAKLADAQFELAKKYGFTSWRSLKAHIDSLTVDGQLFDVTEKGDIDTLTALLDKYPEKLHVRKKPYEWTLLHLAAHKGHLEALDLLLKRGLDVNSREKGDNTYAMHWAAAAGHLDVVKRLADAGGDVVGHGDDHELEIIGWASCWEGCNDAAHRAVVEFLVSRGARHHIFSAIAMNLADEVRRIVADNPGALSARLSRNEEHQLPLHFAVRMNRPEMVASLLELGADPLAGDGSGLPAAAYATSSDIDRRVMEKIRAMTAAELVSAECGQRPARSREMDLIAALALGDWEMAERLLRENPQLLANRGALHLMAKRNNVAGVKWLLDHGADPNARWAHWDSSVTPLHLAVLGNHPEIVRLLLARRADPRIRDSKHDADVMGWADFFRRKEIVDILNEHSLSATE
jgi:ankyrin repeat protein